MAIPLDTPDTARPQPALPQALHDAELALAGGAHARGLDAAQRAIAALPARGAASNPRARAFSVQAQHLWRLGRFEDAAESAQRALTDWLTLDVPAQICEAHCLLATSFTELGLHEDALRHAAAAFELARQQGLASQQTLALNRLGICHERLGEPERGELYLLQALQLARERADGEAELSALNNLAASGIGGFHLFGQRGENAAAQAFLQRARGHAEAAVVRVHASGDIYRQAVIDGNLAEILALQGEYDAAEAQLGAVIAQARAMDYKAVELRTRYTLGEMRIAQGRLPDALAELHGTLDALRRCDQVATRMRVHRALYRAYKSLGHFEPALAQLEAYHQIEMQRAALQSRAQARLAANRDLEYAPAPHAAPGSA